ncbi:FecCD family ABC transporter permease [Plantibacter sp. YIM 135249]|uniref:FecCD family ABC transporter permease n=1 Tax=Plantibacter sp. YIM 135249 TaxID=3423918 RepID=UPI003D32D2E6
MAVLTQHPKARQDQPPLRPHLTTFPIVLIVLLLALVAASAASLLIGARPIPFETAIRAVFAPDEALRATADYGIVVQQRLPRMLLALVVGAALGLAGLLMQTTTRNALADPGILGVNAGAALAIAVSVGFLGITSPLGFVWSGLLGAGIASTVVYLFGAGRGRRSDPLTMTLAGVALTAVLSGVTAIIGQLQPQAFDQLRSWNAGSLQGRGFDVLVAVLPFIAVGVVIAAVGNRSMSLLSLGDDVAVGLGVHLGRVRIGSLLAVMLLCGAATTAAGPIGFIGLMVPHAARRLAGSTRPWPLFVCCGVLGALLLVVADLLGRVLYSGELPAGVVTAFVGAPVLVLLARSRKLREL